MRVIPQGGIDSPIIGVSFPATAASLNIVGTQSALVGFAVVETTGVSAATFDIVDSAADNGPLLCPVSLTPGQSRMETFGPWALAADRAIRIQVLSGSVRGVLYVALLDPATEK